MLFILYSLVCHVSLYFSWYSSEHTANIALDEPQCLMVGDWSSMLYASSNQKSNRLCLF